RTAAPATLSRSGRAAVVSAVGHAAFALPAHRRRSFAAHAILLDAAAAAAPRGVENFDAELGPGHGLSARYPAGRPLCLRQRAERHAVRVGGGPLLAADR